SELLGPGPSPGIRLVPKHYENRELPNGRSARTVWRVVLHHLDGVRVLLAYLGPGQRPDDATIASEALVILPTACGWPWRVGKGSTRTCRTRAAGAPSVRRMTRADLLECRVALPG